MPPPELQPSLRPLVADIAQIIKPAIDTDSVYAGRFAGHHSVTKDTLEGEHVDPIYAGNASVSGSQHGTVHYSFEVADGPRPIRKANMQTFDGKGKPTEALTITHPEAIRAIAQLATWRVVANAPDLQVEKQDRPQQIGDVVGGTFDIARVASDVFSLFVK